MPLKPSLAALALAGAFALSGAALPDAALAQPMLEVAPQQGASSLMPQIFGEGFPESAEVRVYGGTDQERMVPLGTARTGAGGDLRFTLNIPEVSDGNLFYIAVDAGDGLVFTQEPFVVASPSAIDVK